MTVTATWADDAQTLIHLRYAGAWTWVEYLESKQRLLQMAAQVNHTIDIISFAEPDSTHPPSGMIGNITQGLSLLPPNTNLMLVVTDQLFMNTAAKLLPRVRTLDPRIKAVSSLQAAYAMIEASRGAGV